MSEQTDSLMLVQTTLASPEAARGLAEDLIEQRLAACAQLGPVIESIYPWQGRIERQDEVVLTLKTTTDVLAALKARLLDRHPYDVPELIVLPVIETFSGYLDWALDWTRPGNTNN